MFLYAALIIFFAFFYTAIVFNPQETADNLKKHGGFIPGIRPGERTAEMIDYVLTLITVIGAAYLTIIDHKPGQPEQKLFAGWMFASTPALSALDDGVYDVRVLACTMATGSSPPSSR